jgi:hypothetical protein
VAFRGGELRCGRLPVFCLLLTLPDLSLAEFSLESANSRWASRTGEFALTCHPRDIAQPVFSPSDLAQSTDAVRWYNEPVRGTLQGQSSGERAVMSPKVLLQWHCDWNDGIRI